MQIRLIYDFYVFSDLLNTFVFPYHCLDFLLIRYASSFSILHNSSVDVCLSVFGFQGTGCRSLCSDHFLWKRSSGDGEIRTRDPLLARQVLSQLSYTPVWNYSLSANGLKWTRTIDLTLIRRAL